MAVFLEIIEEYVQSNLSKSSEVVYIHYDQLNFELLSIDPNRNEVLIFLEAYAEFRNIPHHKKKITYQISAQRHFALECAKKGFKIIYLTSEGDLDSTLRSWMKENKDAKVRAMQPAEWNSKNVLEKLRKDFNGRLEVVDNTFFMSNPLEWKEKIKNGYVMEFFYREMRKRTGYLMQGDKPEGGEWNYDKDNRQKLPKDKKPPKVIQFSPDEITKEVISLVEEIFKSHFGSLDSFDYAVTKKEAMLAANDFFENRFENFGPYEDALVVGEDLVYHSGLSIYMNNGLLPARELCEMAIKKYNSESIPINSVEGYIRQIIGWREYIRNYYEALMPEIRNTNVFGFEHKIPKAYWDGGSKMKCISECVRPVIDKGYSHHIPRLMVLSNFSNLTETDPGELFKWFWYAYTDAYEWVVLPNVLGMSTFADGGILASKPYVSSGNYINKMSNYCSECSYSVSKKTGENACPFNYLYWNFVDNHRKAFEENGRVSFMVNMYDKKSNEEKVQIKKDSENFINNLDRYEE